MDSPNSSSLFLGGLGTEAKGTVVLHQTRPQPVLTIYTFIFPSNDSAINTLATPSSLVPSPSQAAEQHHDLRVTYPFGIPDLSTSSLPPRMGVTLESGLLGLLPNYFPSSHQAGEGGSLCFAIFTQDV